MGTVEGCLRGLLYLMAFLVQCVVAMVWYRVCDAGERAVFGDWFPVIAYGCGALFAGIVVWLGSWRLRKMFPITISAEFDFLENGDVELTLSSRTGPIVGCTEIGQPFHAEPHIDNEKGSEN